MTQGDELLAKKLQNARRKQLAVTTGNDHGGQQMSNNFITLSSNSPSNQSVLPADIPATKNSIPSSPPPPPPQSYSLDERTYSDKILPKISPTKSKRPKKPWEVSTWVETLIEEGRAKDTADDNSKKLAYLDNRQRLRQTFHLRKLRRKELEYKSKVADPNYVKQDHDIFHLSRARREQDSITTLMNHRDYELSKLSVKTQTRQFLELSSDSRKKTYYSNSPSSSSVALSDKAEQQERRFLDENLDAVKEILYLFKGFKNAKMPDLVEGVKFHVIVYP